jgi:hypothetical protein
MQPYARFEFSTAVQPTRLHGVLFEAVLVHLLIAIRNTEMDGEVKLYEASLICYFWLSVKKKMVKLSVRLIS